MGKCKGRMAGLGLEEAPVFYPTEEEFQHPLRYIAAIRERAEKYGMCKIVPPSSWNPPFALDWENFQFKTKVQAIHQLQERPAGCDPDTFRLDYCRFCEREGLTLVKWPIFDGEEVDMCKLFNAVKRRGGYQRVTNERRWGEVLRMLTPEKAQLESASSISLMQLRQLYESYLVLYEEYHANPNAPVAIPPEVKAKFVADQRALAQPHQTIDVKLQTEGPREVKLKDLKDIGDGVESNSDVRSRPGKHLRSGGRISQQDVKVVGMDGLAETLDSAAVDSVGPTAKKIRLQEGPRELAEKPVEQVRRNDQKCEQCHGGGHEEAMLLCDRCDRGWHLYCLSPPLDSVPDGNWYCLECVNSEREGFGFCTGQEHTLSSFQRMADRFKRKWFGSDERLRSLTLADTEAEFWRIVERSTQPVEVLYGSDLDTSQYGSGFPRKSDSCPPGRNRELWQKYAKSPWNLNNMPKIEGSMLRHIDDNIPGVIVPWLYVGMAFSSFCWHYEDHCFYSINYLHWGDAKQWYGVPGFAAESFESVMKQAFPDLFEAQPDLLFQLVTMLSPSVLKENAVPIYSCLQEAREFVITFPRSYHGGFNYGFNCAEAVNFAPPDWFPWGGCGVERYRLFRRSAILSHEELLCVVAKSGEHEPETLQWLRKELGRVVAAERKHRTLLWTEGTVRSTKMPPRAVPDRITSDEDPECMICRYYLHLSAVTCVCRPGEAVCLQHSRQLCECLASRRTLHYRHTLAELEDFLYTQKEDKKPQSGDSCQELVTLGGSKRSKPARTSARQVAVGFPGGSNGADSGALLKKMVKGRLVSHAEQATLWAARAKGALRNPPTLTTVEELLEEVEEFLWGGHEVAPVREIEQRLRSAKQWAAEVALCCGPATLAGPQGAGQPNVPPKDPRGRGVPLEKVTALLAVEPPPCVESHLKDLRGLLAKAETLQQRILDAIATRPPVEFKVLHGLYQEALRAPIEVPELKQLKELLSAAQAWVDAVRKVLPTSKAIRRRPQAELPGLPHLLTLQSQGQGLAVRMGEHSVLEAAISKVQSWLQKAQQLLGARPSVQAVAAALEEAETVPARLPEAEKLRQQLEKAQEWAQRARDALFARRSTLHGASWQAPSTVQLEELIGEGSQLQLEVAEMRWLEMEVKKQEWLAAASQVLAVKTEVKALTYLAAEAASLQMAGDLVTRLQQTAETAAAWEAQAEKALRQGATMDEFANLARSAEHMNAKLTGIGDVSAALQQARAWQERAQPLLRGKSRGRHRFSTERLPLHVLQQLVAELGEMPVVMKEAEHVKARLAETEEWRTKAKDLMAAPLFPRLCRTSAGPCDACASKGLWGHLLAEGQDAAKPGKGTGGGEKQGDSAALGARRLALLEAILDDGLALGVEVPEVGELRGARQRVDWQVRAQKLLEAKGTVAAVEQAVQDGRQLLAAGGALDQGRLSALEAALQKSRAWLSIATPLAFRQPGDGTTWTKEQLQALLEEAHRLPVLVAVEQGLLERMLNSQRVWLREVQGALASDSEMHLTSVADLRRLLEEGTSSGVQCADLLRLPGALEALQRWTERCREVVLKAAGTESCLLSLLHQMQSNLEGALALVGRQGPVPVPVGVPRLVGCACLQPLEGARLGAMLHCESCKDWFHAECVGPGPHTARVPGKRYTCPFCAALCTGNLALSRETYSKIHATSRPALTSLRELRDAAAAMPCRSEETEQLVRVVELAEEWQARLKGILAPALELPRGVGPLTGPALVIVLKAAGAVEVQEEDGGLLRAAVAAQAWRVRACQLLLAPTKPSMKSLAGLLKEGLVLVGKRDGVLLEVKQRDAKVRAWVAEAKKVAEDEGEAPVERVQELIKAGEGLPAAFDKELEVLRGRCQLYCKCQKPCHPRAPRPMLHCRCCKEWYHHTCLGLREPLPGEDDFERGPCIRGRGALWDEDLQPASSAEQPQAGRDRGRQRTELGGEREGRKMEEQKAEEMEGSIRRSSRIKGKESPEQGRIQNLGAAVDRSREGVWPKAFGAAEKQPRGGGEGAEQQMEGEFVCPKCTEVALERERVKALELKQRTLLLQQRAEQLVQKQKERERQQQQQQQQRDRQHALARMAEAAQRAEEEAKQLEGAGQERSGVSSTRGRRTMRQNTPARPAAEGDVQSPLSSPAAPPSPPLYPIVRGKRSTRHLHQQPGSEAASPPSAYTHRAAPPAQEAGPGRAEMEEQPCPDQGEKGRIPDWQEGPLDADGRGEQPSAEGRQGSGGRPCRRTAGQHSGYDGFVLLTKSR